MLGLLIIISGGWANYSGGQAYHGALYCPGRKEVSNG